MRLPFVVLALAAALASSTGAVPLSDDAGAAGAGAGAAAAIARAPAPFLRPSHGARHLAPSATPGASLPLDAAAAAAPQSLAARLLSMLGHERRAAAPVRRTSAKKHKRGNKVKRCAASSSSSSSTSSSSTSTAPMTTSTSLPPTQNAAARQLVAGGYWADWTAGTLPPESIDFSKFDFVNYAFGTPNSDATISFSSGSYSESLLKRLVAAAHKANSKVVLSLGGWGNSGGFSGAVSSDSQRSKFIRNIVAMQAKFGLDGFDFDWEYPNNVQGGTNRPEDTRNLQTFLVSLRAAVPKGTLLSAAVPHQPWLSSANAPVGSVARAASALDYIVIMNYDVWGASSRPGPNAPLGNLCGNSTQPAASAAAGVKQWAAAGMPRSKMLLGIPAYGYINTSTRRKLIQRDADELAAPNLFFVRDEEERNPLKRAAAVTNLEGNTSDGQVNFSGLVSQGVLKAAGDGTYVAGSGWTKYWDDCSDTPFLSDGSKVITYDDTYSLYDKGAFAQQAGIAGVNMWSIDGDTKSWSLINSARKGMGLK